MKDQQNKQEPIIDLKKVKLKKEVVEQIIKEQDQPKEYFEESQKQKDQIKPISQTIEEIEKEETTKENLFLIYQDILFLLKKYIDLKEEYYNLLALWIIGTYFHQNFPSYPYLFFNAMKGSGKSRAMNLITGLCREGEMLSSPTEAVLFRTRGTLGIDEFEGLERKGYENIRELLNCAYKKGVFVKRMKKVKTLEGEQQIVESFEVYRPVVMANIYGMEGVLGDRCLTLILEKSNRQEIINLLEIFKNEKMYFSVFKELNFILNITKCRLCYDVVMQGVYREWNEYLINTINTNNIYNINNINNTITTNNTINKLDTTNEFFDKIISSGISGRDLELAFPLLIIANEIQPTQTNNEGNNNERKNNNLLGITIQTLKTLFEIKKEEDFSESKDVALIDFCSQYTIQEYFVPLNHFVSEFKEFLGSSDEWINARWMGRALKRLALIKEKRRVSRGAEIIIDIEKAKKKIGMFKP